jgi:hypothetical protein
VDLNKMKDAVAGLDRVLLTLEATGDYAGTKKLMSEMMVMRPEVQKALERLKSVPVDIEPKFFTADQLLTQEAKGRSSGPAAGKKPAVAAAKKKD